MSRLILSGTALTLLVAIVAVPVRGGDKEVSAKGQVQLGKHTMKMDPKQLYWITVEGKNFNPVLVLRAGFSFRVFQVPFDKKFKLETSFMPAKGEDHDLLVGVDLFGLGAIPAGPLDYSISVKPIPLAEPILSINDKLDATDPLFKPERDSHFKAFPVKLKAGQLYIIDMVKKAQIDPYLYLEGPDKKIVARDDDSGGDLNARIVYQAKVDGDYRIIATTLFKATGEFTLTVRTSASSKDGGRTREGR